MCSSWYLCSAYVEDEGKFVVWVCVYVSDSVETRNRSKRNCLLSTEFRMVLSLFVNSLVSLNFTQFMPSHELHPVEHMDTASIWAVTITRAQNYAHGKKERDRQQLNNERSTSKKWLQVCYSFSCLVWACMCSSYKIYAMWFYSLSFSSSGKYAFVLSVIFKHKLEEQQIIKSTLQISYRSCFRIRSSPMYYIRFIFPPGNYILCVCVCVENKVERCRKQTTTSTAMTTDRSIPCASSELEKRTQINEKFIKLLHKTATNRLKQDKAAGATFFSRFWLNEQEKRKKERYQTSLPLFYFIFFTLRTFGGFPLFFSPLCFCIVVL